MAEHFALEAGHLQALPTEPFDYKAINNFRADRKARVNVRGAWYSVPARYAGRRVDVRIGAETIEALDGARVVAAHPRSLKGEENLVLDHYLEVLAIKPGALPGATALARARLWRGVQRHPRPVLGRSPPAPRRPGRHQSPHRGIAVTPGHARPRRRGRHGGRPGRGPG